MLSSLLDFEYETDNGTSRLDQHNLYDGASQVKGITERFVLSVQESQVKGTWYSGDKELPVSIGGNNLNIGHEKSYLKLPGGSYFDLSNLGLRPYASVKITGSANGGKNTLISYDEPANLNYGGRCGGGRNAGFIAISFDDDFALLDVKQAVLEACYQDIYSENEKQVSESVTEYEVYVPGQKPKPVYIVDTAKATINEK